MPNVAAVLKEEIRRLARKEAKAATVPLKKALAAERKSVAALRKQVATLSKVASSSARGAGRAPAVEPTPGASTAGWRKDTVRSTRRQLELTQAQLAKLIGVSQITISFWETGRTTPRQKQQLKVLEARKLSRTQAHARLGIAGGRRKPGPKPGKKTRRKKVGGKKVRGKKPAGRKAGARGRSRKA